MQVVGLLLVKLNGSENTSISCLLEDLKITSLAGLSGKVLVLLADI